MGLDRAGLGRWFINFFCPHCYNSPFEKYAGKELQGSSDDFKN